MTKTRRLMAIAASGAAFGLIGAGASPAEAATCNPKRNSYAKGQGYYLAPFRTTGFTCAGGYKVRAAHYKCRTRTSQTGRCPRFNGWRCSERRQSGAINYIGTVRCRKGGLRLLYRYEQDK